MKKSNFYAGALGACPSALAKGGKSTLKGGKLYEKGGKKGKKRRMQKKINGK